MLIVETIREIRLSIQRDGNSIRQTARALGYFAEHGSQGSAQPADGVQLPAKFTAAAGPGRIHRAFGEFTGRGLEAGQTATPDSDCAF